MALATGISKLLVFKPEVTWGTAAAATGPFGQGLRRVSSDISLVKKTYESNEIRPDQQVADFRHGIRSVTGTIEGELSSGTYANFIAALLRGSQTWTAGAATAAIAVTAVAGSGGTGKFTRAGSWITDGIKIGDVVRFTGFTTTGATGGSNGTGNNATNFRVLALTATDLTVDGLVVAKVEASGVTTTVAGKKNMVPLTGFSDTSFTIEHWFADIAQSEQYLGCKIVKADFNLPSSGMATVSFGILGKDAVTGTAQYFTTPLAATTFGVDSAVGGKVAVGGVDYATLTGMKFTIDGQMNPAEVIGSNSLQAVFQGVVKVTGEFTCFFENAVLRDMFVNETIASLNCTLYAGGTQPVDFVSFTFPAVKVGSASKGDGGQGIIQTFSFVALLPAAGGAGVANDRSTVIVQDSQA